MRSVIVLLFLFLAPGALAAEPAEDCVVLVLGDSISAAYGMEQSESWPALLSTRLSEDGYRCRVFNSSITGDTTEGGLSRLPRLLDAQRPAVIVVELGGNDGLRGLPLDVTEANLREMIRLGKEQGAAVVLAGIQLPPNYVRTYTERFRNLYPLMAEETGASLIRFILEGVALSSELMQDDGIHPNARAQPIILETVWSALEPLLP